MNNSILKIRAKNTILKSAISQQNKEKTLEAKAREFAIDTLVPMGMEDAHNYGKQAMAELNEFMKANGITWNGEIQCSDCVSVKSKIIYRMKVAGENSGWGDRWSNNKGFSFSDNAPKTETAKGTEKGEKVSQATSESVSESEVNQVDAKQKALADFITATDNAIAQGIAVADLLQAVNAQFVAQSESVAK